MRENSRLVVPLPAHARGDTESMMDFKRKKICTDEDTLNNLRNMKADRLRLGLTQAELAKRSGIKLRTYHGYEYGTSYPNLAAYLKLAEILGWDIHENPNYLFYEEYQHSHNRMQTQKRRYAYTNIELSREVNLSEESVRHVIKKNSIASVSNYARVMQVFREEARLAEIRRRQR